MKSNFQYILAILILALIVTSCEKTVEVSAELPICQDCGEPNHFLDDNGELYISYIKYLTQFVDELRYRKFSNGEWSKEHSIASGEDWFVNWADFPSFSKTNQFMAAHWLQKSDEGAYDYDIHVSTSKTGTDWSNSFTIHRDSISAEHGFVSMLPYGERIFATWLDGRNTKHVDDDLKKHRDHNHAGSMTLRAAFFNEKGELSEEQELDQRICDCCQTAACETDSSIIVAYRDRSESEIRDISRVVYNKNTKQWSDSAPIHVDGWNTSGCPVNGPSLSSLKNQIACGWFTLAQGQERLKLSISKDQGYNFSPALTIDSTGVLGRVDVEWIDESRLCLAYLKEENDEGILAIKIYDQLKNKISSVIDLPMDVDRSSGFPRISVQNNRLYLSYVKTGDSKSIVHQSFPLLPN